MGAFGLDNGVHFRLGELAERSLERIEEEVRQALSNKGYSDRLIQAACEHIREQFAAEKKQGGGFPQPRTN